ncbi:MAG: YggT family protein [Atopobium sp.]|nr:YggT family protein [Atopobium sp.]
MFSYYVLNSLYTLLRIYSFCIVVWCLSSWITVSNDSVKNILEAIGKIVEPYLSVIRNVIPPISGVDLSPIVALFVLNLVGRFAISTLGLILI